MATINAEDDNFLWYWRRSNSIYKAAKDSKDSTIAVKDNVVLAND